jgi:hypothetical protein
MQSLCFNGRLLSCLVFLLPLALNAEDLYVRPSYSAGTHTGADWTNAWNGFADVKWGTGAGKVSPGDTLWMAGGVYNARMLIGASGTAGSPITIKRVLATDSVPAAAAGWDSSLDSQVVVTSTGSLILFNGGVGSYVTVDGQIPSGIRLNYANGGSGVELDGAVNFTDVTLRYIESAGPGPVVQTGDTRGFDLTTQAGLNNITLSHCEAHHSDTLLQVTRNTNLVIEYCELHHAGAVNAATYHPNTIYLGTSTNAAIRYNKLHDIDVEGIFFGDDGSSGVQIYGNLFYQGASSPNSGRGIEFDNTASSSGFLIYNNTFVGLPLAAVNFNNGKTHTSAVVQNNIFYNISTEFGSAAHDYNWYSGSGTGEAHGIANGAAPFVSAAAYDYHLVATVGQGDQSRRSLQRGSRRRYPRGGWELGHRRS